MRLFPPFVEAIKAQQCVQFNPDEMNLYLLTTEKMLRSVKYMEPYNNILGLTGPDEFSGNLKFPKTITSLMSNWMNQ